MDETRRAAMAVRFASATLKARHHQEYVELVEARRNDLDNAAAVSDSLVAGLSPTAPRSVPG